MSQSDLDNAVNAIKAADNNPDRDMIIRTTLEAYTRLKRDAIRAKAYTDTVELCHEYAMHTTDVKTLNLLQDLEGDILQLFEDKKGE